MDGKKQNYVSQCDIISRSLSLSFTFLNQCGFSATTSLLPGTANSMEFLVPKREDVAVYPFPPTSDFPVLCVRFHLDPRSPVCTDLSTFPKWMCRYLSVLFLFLVNMASYYFLPWGLCRSLFQNEHLAGSAGDAATPHCSSDCLLSVVQIPRQPCHLLPNLTWPATGCFTLQ